MANELRGIAGVVGEIPFVKSVPYCMDFSTNFEWDSTNALLKLAGGGSKNATLGVAESGSNVGLSLRANTAGATWSTLQMNTISSTFPAFRFLGDTQDSLTPPGHGFMEIVPPAYTNAVLQEFPTLWVSPGALQFVGGSLGSQRYCQLLAPSITGAAAVTITNAATLYVEAPSAGVNATLTHPYAGWFHGDVVCDSSIILGVGGTGHAGFITIAPQAIAAGLQQPLIYTLPGTDTNVTASAELIYGQFNGAAPTWNTGAIATQRFYQFLAPTLRFNGASTVTNCATLYAEIPLAGSNATLTNAYAAWFNGQIRVDSAAALGGGAAATLGTIGGVGPATAAQNQWLQINVGGNKRFIPLWA